MTNAIVRFLKDEEGATAIEYGILAGLMATLLASIFGASGTTSFGAKLTAAFAALADKVNPS